MPHKKNNNKKIIIMGFWKNLISDDNDINEKSFVGVVSFFAMVFTLIADVVTGILGQKLVIEEFIFNGFLILTSVSFGISMAGTIFDKNKKEENNATE
jgi:hypothetical protein